MPPSRSSRLLPFAVLAVISAVALAACSGGGGPGWTYAPAPSATPVPSGTATPSGSPQASEPSGTTVTIVATTALKFDTPEVTAPAGQPFTLVFDNQDATALHNVVIQDLSGGLVDIGDTTPYTGPEARNYSVPALTAGAYPFLCQVHPTTMTGTLTAE
jgi:plastocyanin